MHTAQSDHTEEVLDVVLPANYQPTKMMEPSEKSLNSPTAAVATKRATVLGGFPSHSAMRSDHLNIVSLGYNMVLLEMFLDRLMEEEPGQILEAGDDMKSTWITLVVAAAIGFIPICRAAPEQRIVFHNTLISRHDPAVEIKLPAFVHYVGTDRFLLSDPKIGNFDACELYAFVDSDQGRDVRKFYWIQFEGYLPAHPHLHFTYDSPRHATIGGLDFYVDTGLSSPAKPPKPGSDGARFRSLLASNGYRRDDMMSVRLVHLVDTMKRKELMIIYGESLAPTGYSAAQLAEGGTEHAKWAAIEDGLIQRAEQSFSIRPK